MSAKLFIMSYDSDDKALVGMRVTVSQNGSSATKTTTDAGILEFNVESKKTCVVQVEYGGQAFVRNTIVRRARVMKTYITDAGDITIRTFINLVG